MLSLDTCTDVAGTADETDDGIGVDTDTSCCDGVGTVVAVELGADCTVPLVGDTLTDAGDVNTAAADTSVGATACTGTGAACGTT